MEKLARVDGVVGCGPCWDEVSCSKGASLWSPAMCQFLKWLFWERQVPWRNVAVFAAGKLGHVVERVLDLHREGI